jgi:branched-chain amino acid transport system ATP-binding protein
MLTVENLVVAYDSLEVVRGISFRVEEGEIVTILGSNGAGKTTTLRSLSGLHRPRAGRILLKGEDISQLPAHRVVARGLCLVPEGRQLFPDHTVMENLELGAYRRLRAGEGAAVRRDREQILDLFPRVRERLDQKAGLLSGGEQQMVAIARALISRPAFLMLDEPSLGLAPMLLRSIFESFVKMRARGLTLLIVEQIALLGLQICDRAYVLESGRLVIAGARETMLKNPRVIEAYLGKKAEP